MNKRYDVAIVGAGILGSFAAYHAWRKGLSVLLLEAGATPRGATVRNFGQVVPSGQDLNGWRQLGMRSLALYKEVANAFKLPIQEQGSLYVASDEAECELLQELAEFDAVMEYQSEQWNVKQCLNKVPCLKTSYAKLGLYYPQEISVDSDVFLPLFIKKLGSQENVSYRYGSSVTAIESNDEGVQLTLSDKTELDAGQAIVCSGHYLNRLLPLAGTVPQLTIARLQMLASSAISARLVSGNLLTGLSIRRYPAFKSCSSYQAINTPEHLQALEAEGIHILIKQSQNGELIIGDSHQYYKACESDSLDFHMDESVNQLILNELKRIVDIPDLAINRAWNGYYSQLEPQGVYANTLDTNIHVVTGIGGKGMSTGPGLMEKVLNFVADRQAIDTKELLMSKTEHSKEKIA